VASRKPDERTPDEVWADRPGPEAQSGRLRGAEAFRLHCILVAGLVLCVAAFVFEISRALGGNTLSWAYVFEWPIFAVFALYMWWNLLHGQDGSRTKRRARKLAASHEPSDPPVSPPDAGADAELLAWQAYLADMDADEARQSEKPGAD